MVLLNLLSPDLGLFFWTLLVFVLFFFLLRKFAWKYILKGLKDREQSIADSLNSAEKAREEMKKLTAQNEKILVKAKSERDKILKEARDAGSKLIAETRERAKEEGDKMIAKARQEIQNEKMAALTEVKNQVGLLAISVAEKILKKKFEDHAQQKAFVAELVDEINLN